MPHQCTNCGHTFPDGSKEMLSGCPDCGGNKFQFKPAGQTESQSATDQSTSPPPTTDSSSSTPPTTNSPSSTQSPPETEGVESDTDATADQPLDSSTEAPAQSTARSDVVTDQEVTAAGSMGPQSDDEESTPDSQPAGTEPAAESSPEAAEDGSSLDQLRKELNDQFESIRIVSPGQYELNLMELYDRDEYIISLREDGRYVIEVPDGWGDS
ncbi:hypothetical protein halTADL_1917 [Halohasta litchfieldiae]|uniref:Zn-ribbon containing protein n=1 Tax=Halohasta litchfieldiae TaxID=1073996 RepID=A0A1H6QU53_9EURY|nr:Zn-ribbon containing protein [Halohasta litchfieldiae]ATW88669.1 hypothetical protein halTADL_1917 [Halohasta litchfieldiae]SEI47149.1 hypothetical protein SAMN05444271_10147 [Halohasta litchfieldiae]